MLKSIPVEYLHRGRYQPREHFDDKTLHELSDSIRTHGIIEPLVVREMANNHYEIIAGERRWRAATLAGLATVPCLIGHYSDEQAAAVTLIENIQRDNLTLWEEAKAYQRLALEFHFSQQDIADLSGKSRSHIANLVRLLNLSPPVLALLKKNQLSLGHARLLVGLTPAQQLQIATKLKQYDWSVRELEKKIRSLKNQPLPKKRLNADIAALEDAIAEQLGSPVEISSTKAGGGWMKIRFYDNDTLCGLLERLGLRYD